MSAVLHLWSLNAADSLDGAEAGPAALALGAESVLHLLHALVSAPGRPRPRTWLVTSDAQPVTDADRCAAPWSAILWGLGRSFAAEHPDLWGGLIDLDRRPAPSIADWLIREVQAGGTEDKVAFRGGERYVARLFRGSAPRRPSDEFVARADGTYLITGGLGGIGLEVARWLVGCGARHLLLLGRTALPPRDRWQDLDPDSMQGRRVRTVLGLEAMGAKVEAEACDIGAPGELERCLAAHRERGAPAIRGVFHAAGVFQMQPLEALDVSSLRGALAAKTEGAWRLHCSLRDAALDCFVLFSSSAALLRFPLLGAYAGANAFLDTLAHHRRASGLPALSVNWGVWRGVGMAATADAKRRPADGTSEIPTRDGIAALQQLLVEGDVQTAVMPIDWPTFARAYPAIAADPFLEATTVAASDGAERGAGASRFAEPANEQPLRGAAAITAYLCAEAARVLGMPRERCDAATPLNAYGLDSLMAVQLRSRIQADLGVVLPIIEFLRGATVSELATAILEATERNEQPAARADKELAWEVGTL